MAARLTDFSASLATFTEIAFNGSAEIYLTRENWL